MSPKSTKPVKPIMFEHDMYELTDGNMLKRKDPETPQTIEEMESLLESLGSYVQVRKRHRAGSDATRQPFELGVYSCVAAVLKHFFPFPRHFFRIP